MPAKRRNTAATIDGMGVLLKPQELVKANISADDTYSNSIVTESINTNRTTEMGISRYSDGAKKIGYIPKLASVFGLEDFSIFYSNAPNS